MIKQICACLGVLLCVAFPTYGTELSLSTDHIFPQNSNLGYADTSVELVEGTARVYDWMDASVSGNFVGKLAWKAAFITALYTPYNLESAVGLVYHEYGHYSRALAAGGAPVMQIVHEFGNGGSVGAPTTGYFQLLWDVITHPTISGAQVVTSLPTTISDTISKNDMRTVVSAAGMNNEVYVASQLAEHMFLRQEQSVFTAHSYFQNKLAVLEYALSEEGDVFSGDGDLLSVLSAYERKGVSLSLSDMKQMNMATHLLSATSWAYWINVVDYLYFDGDVRVPAPIWNGWRLPDFSLYLNVEGPAVHAQSGYVVSDELHLLFGVETIVEGADRTEFDFGWVSSNSVDQSRWFFHTYVGSGISAFLGRSEPIGDNVRIRYQVRHYSMDTFFGLRHTPSILDSTATELEMALQYVF